MKGRNLLILVVLAAALVAAAIFVRKKDSSLPPEDVGKLLMPDLAVNDIQKVVINTASATTALERVEGKWVCANRYGYPIDFGKLREVLVDLYEAKIGDVIPGASERLEQLGIVPPGKTRGDADAEGGALVELFFEGKTEPRLLLLGKTHMKKPTGEAAAYGGYADGRYASTDAGKTVYLVPETLDDLTLTDPTLWLDTDLLSVSSSDIRAISIAGPGRDPISIAREKDSSDLEVQGIKKNEEADTSKLNSINGALSYLRMNDVADRVLSDEQVGMTSSVVFTATTKKDEVYTIRIGSSPEDSSDHYIRIAVAMASPRAEAEEVEEADPKKGEEPASDDSKKDEEKKKRDEEKKKEEEERQKTAESVEKLNRKFSGWTYLVSSYKAESFTTKRSELVKKKKKKEEKKDEEGKKDK